MNESRRRRIVTLSLTWHSVFVSHDSNFDSKPSIWYRTWFEKKKENKNIQIEKYFCVSVSLLCSTNTCPFPMNTNSTTYKSTQLQRDYILKWNATRIPTTTTNTNGRFEIGSNIVYSDIDVQLYPVQDEGDKNKLKFVLLLFQHTVTVFSVDY